MINFEWVKMTTRESVRENRQQNNNFHPIKALRRREILIIY